LETAVKRFSVEFAVSSQNLRKWCFAFAILSAWWMMEDFGENSEKTLALADIWNEMK
jgi:streptomycin 6-kinase